MTAKRIYSVDAHVAPSVKKPPKKKITGSVFVGAWDAAKNYATLYLPGYDVISCKFVKVQDTEADGLHSLFKAEATNHETQLGAAIYIREL